MSVERRGQVIRALITLVNWQQEEPTDVAKGGSSSWMARAV